MVSWWADGKVSGFAIRGAGVAKPVPDAYFLASNGTVNVNGITRLQYPISSADRSDRINAVAYLTINNADLAERPNRNSASATMFVAQDTNFAPGAIPTPDQILALGDEVVRSYRSATRVSVAGDHTFEIAGPRISELQAGGRYWVLVMPSAPPNDLSRPPSVARDLPLRGFPNAISRGLSMWTNRPPAKPTITSPATNTTVNGGTVLPLSFTSSDPDAIAGGVTFPYTDLAGVQVQCAFQTFGKEGTPDWRDMGMMKSGEVVAGWYLHRSSVNGGAAPLWENRTMPMVCGADTGLDGQAILPSGECLIRMRTFDFGHPYPQDLYPGGFSSGLFSPQSFPDANTSEWSDPVTVRVNAQVPAPQPISPANANSVVEGNPLTLKWRYRNTYIPPYPQRSRTVQIREVGVLAWTTLVSGNVIDSTSDDPSFDVPSTVVLSAGKQYEWRVKVTDSDLVDSTYSAPARFWVVPPPGSGIVAPAPAETVENATLGTGTYRVHVYRRGGLIKVGELDQISRLDWERVRDDISTAKVTISGWGIDAGNLLRVLQTWAYEIVIFRQTAFGIDRVWEGPITLLTYERDAVTIQAKDVMAYPYRRIVKQDMHDFATGDTVTSRAARVLQNVMAPDDPNVLAHMVVLAREDDAQERRSLTAFSRSGFEEIDDMAANAGLDYTVIGRSIMVWGTKHRIGTLPEFRDEHLGNSPIVSEYGMAMANFYAVSDGNGVYGSASRLDVSGNDPTYGLIDMLASSWSSDSAEDTGTYTQAGLEAAVKAFQESAEKGIAVRYPPPVVVRIPDNTSLNPNIAVSIQHLVPGVAIPLRSTATLRPVTGTQKLDSIKVVQDDKGEKITITMSPFSRDDAGLTDETGE